MVPTMFVAEGVALETGALEIVQAVETQGRDVTDGELALRAHVARCVELAVSGKTWCGKTCMRAVKPWLASSRALL